MRILNGISAVSLQSTRGLSDALKQLGHQSDVVVYRQNGLLVGLEDRNLGIDMTRILRIPLYSMRVLKFFLKCLKQYDVFHFHGGHSLLPLNLDLRILKCFGKRVVMEYHGSDVRRRTVFARNNPYSHLFPTDRLLVDRVAHRRQRRVAAGVDGIIVHDQELREQLYPLGRPIWTVPLRITLDEYPRVPATASDCRPGEDSGITICHAPTNQDMKGTVEVTKAIRRLSRRHKIDFRLITGVSRADALEAYRESDLIVDQLLVGTYGMLSVEGMALGKPVVTYLRSDLVSSFCEVPPICNATVDTLEAVLEELILDPALRTRLGKAGREYVARNHNSLVIAQRVVAEVYSP
jgi:glycosyltransferase involved in cell wall biosynthesis